LNNQSSLRFIESEHLGTENTDKNISSTKNMKLTQPSSPNSSVSFEKFLKAGNYFGLGFMSEVSIKDEKSDWAKQLE